QALTQCELKQDLSGLTEGLRARALVNMNRYAEYTVDRQYLPFYYDMQSYSLTDQTYKLQRLNPASGTEYINYVPRDRFINTVFYLESAVDYNRTFHDVHGLGGLLVYTMRSQKTGISDNLQLSL